MTGYLLDTNIVSDLVRNPGGRVAQRIREVGEVQICTSIIVASELRYGAATTGSARLSAQLDTILRSLEVLPFEAPADNVYALLRTRPESAGQVIGGNDLLTAAQGTSLGHTVVTANEREFGRIDDLKTENWLAG